MFLMLCYWGMYCNPLVVSATFSIFLILEKPLILVLFRARRGRVKIFRGDIFS